MYNMPDGSRYLIISLEAESFAVPVDRVAEIATAQGLEQDQNLAAAFEGRIEIRGRRIPVLNLKRLFKLPGKPGNVLLVIKSAKGEVGILVDAVTEILDTDRQPLPMPKGAVNPSLPYYGGIFRHKGELILLLNENALL